jgi:hypothetical protein
MLDFIDFAQFLPPTVTTTSATSVPVTGDSDYDGPTVEIAVFRGRRPGLQNPVCEAFLRMIALFQSQIP